MDKLSEEQQVKAVALEAASRIVSENLQFFVRVHGHATNDREAEHHATRSAQAVIGLARHFEEYVTGPRDARGSR